MAKNCTYSFTAPDGQKVVLTGQAAIKAWLASGGLEYLRGAANDARSSAERDLQYPLAPAGERYEETGIKPRMMSPDEFLASVRPLDIDGASRDNIEDLKQHILSGRKLDPLHIRSDGKEDGRHRAVAAKELGIKLVPVIDERGGARASRARDVTETPEFKRWFGDSKVVDANGKPLVVYHGTNAVFDAFNKAPVFVAKSKSAANNYGPVHMKLYVAINNPALLDDDKFRSLAWNQKEVEGLKARGFDGAKAIGQNVWAAFRPAQIKSATGNRGTFDPNDPDITRSTERDYADNPNFKKWFGDSVMTETGEPGGKPLRLYHGGFPLMDAPPGKGIPKSSARGSLGYGFYMTPDERRAETYAGESGGWGRPDGRVTALYARLQNPLVIEHADGRDPVITGLVATGMPRDKAIKKVEKANEEYGWTGKELMSAATKAGHDGLVFKRDGKISEVVVYQPTQVKSADGNDGSFSWNPDIRRSAEREEEADAVYKELAKDEKLIDALEVYMTSGDAPEGELNDKLLSYIRRLPPVSEDSYLTFYRNQPQGARPWARGWSSWTINEDQTRFFGGRNFEVLRRKGAQGLDLGRLGEQRTRDTGEFHQYGSQGEWLLLNESVFGEGAIRSTERPWYYSQLARAIEGVPARLDNQPGVMWAQWLKANASKLGVKQDEITWSGIEDFLKLKGKEKVSKEEIGAYLSEGGVRVEEVVLGAPDYSEVEAWWGDEGGANEETPFSDLSEQEKRGAAERYADEVGQYSEGDRQTPKHAQHTLPGGTAYREVLLTLPAAETPAQILARLKKKYPEWKEGVRYDTFMSEADQRDLERSLEGSKANYRSSHWDQPNVLAHIRLNDRADADGRRVLFVEELQSDFGADRRKAVAAINKAVDSDFQGIVDRMKKAGVLEVVCD
jgi:hypothetical protein